jgi:dipeptidase E
MHKTGIIPFIRKKIAGGTPYIGWSAGSNVACPTLMTTNDMPVIEPESFETFKLVPFQINPHYTEKTLRGHGGETREMRISEYIEINQDKTVLGLPEGSLLQIEGQNMTMKGAGTMKIFRKGMSAKTAVPGDTLDWLLVS